MQPQGASRGFQVQLPDRVGKWDRRLLLHALTVVDRESVSTAWFRPLPASIVSA